MGTYRKPQDLANHQRVKAERLAHSLKIEHQRLANDCYVEAHKLTGGKITTRILRAMGSPFGRRAGSSSIIGTKRTTLARQRGIKNSRMRLPTLPINRQSGKLQDAIRLTRRGGTGKVTQTYILQVLRNMAPYAKYILSLSGTVKMVTRPFWATLYKFWKKRNFELLIKMRQEQRKG